MDKKHDESSKLRKDAFDNSIFHEKHQGAEQGKDEFDQMMSNMRDMYKQKNEKTEQERREHYEEDLKDETMLKNVMSKIAEDDFKLTKHKLEMNEILESHAERKVIREQQKAFDAQEEEHYQEEAREVVNRDAMNSAEKEHMLDAAFYKSNKEKMFENDKEERSNKLEKEEIDMQYREDLRQQIVGNASRRQREHEVEDKKDRDANAKWEYETACDRVRDVSEYDKEPENEFERKARLEAEFRAKNAPRMARDMNWMESRMEDTRMAQRLADIKAQAELVEQPPDNIKVVDDRAKKDALMGKEIKTIEDEKATALLKRHHLREKEPTLRELMTKIQAGYVCRDVKQQIQHNEYKRLQDKLEELKKDEFLNKQVYNEIEQAARDEKQEFERMMAYKRDILKQKSEIMERQKKEQEEERLNDKKIIENVNRKLSEDINRELQRKVEKKEKLRREMLDFLEKRRISKEEERARAKAEEEKIKEEFARRGSQSDLRTIKREENFHNREKTNERIMAKVQATEAEMKKRSELNKFLQEQERLEKNAQDEVTEKKKENWSKRDTKEVLTWQMQSRIDAAAQERAREAEFKRNADKRALEETVREQEKERKVREKRRRYAEELKQQIVDNERRRKRALEEEHQRERNVTEYEKAWLAQVEEERKKIVQEHVPHVLGYLQKGVIQAQDLPDVKEGAQKHEELKSLDIESMASQRNQKYPKCNTQCWQIRNN